MHIYHYSLIFYSARACMHDIITVVSHSTTTCREGHHCKQGQTTDVKNVGPPLLESKESTRLFATLQ